MYKLTNQNSVIRLTDLASIPFDKNNTDYKDYLKWLEAGNTAEQADVVLEPTVEQKREQAYRIESDALYFQEKRGEVPEGTWLKKVDDIKKRFPKPDRI